MKVLLVIDMQNDFISGALGSPEAQAIVERVAAKIKDFDGQVWATRDTHEENYLSTPEGQKLPVPHCIRGTKGWEIADGLYAEGCRIIDKPNFGWPHWDEIPLEAVELVGLCSDICVVSNALIIKATHPDIPVSANFHCCAGVTPEAHLHAFNVMNQCQIDINYEE
jgi:nicotinamidase-related amidase